VSRPEDGPGGLLTPRVLVVQAVDNPTENRIQMRPAYACAILGESRADLVAIARAIE
jgi:hypothetical protein